MVTTLRMEAGDMQPFEANDSVPASRDFGDDAARALRAVFSSHDNWLNLSEAQRDEWRG
jgi:hypothetical protein